MSDGKLIAGLCLKVPLCSEDMSALFSYTEKIRADGFQAGAASRDAEVAELNRRIEYWRNTARKYLVPETQVRKP